ncbi:MAG: response regulator [Verrucomicrobiales bacterium]|nr:response regulator [Verrucomicrobiales bacterium]
MQTSRTRLLIIDDEVGLTQLMKINLERFGDYLVEVVNHSPAAFAAALKFRPDLILLDMEMPLMAGEEVLKNLKSEPLLEKIPVVAFSAFDERGTGSLPRVPKPVTLDRLMKTINSNLVG